MPDIRSIIRRHLASLGLSGPEEEDIIEEAALDLEERYGSALRDGVDPVEALGMVEAQAQQLAAELKTTLASDPQARTETFGQLSPSKDSSSQTAWQRLLSWPFYLVQSGRQAAQILRKNLGFTMGAAAMLGLCLGANLTIFAVIDSILLRPLPFPDGDRLVTTLHSYPLAEIPRSMASLPNYYDYRREIKAFESTAMIHTDYSGPTIVGGMGSPFKVDCDRVSPEFFHTLGVPLLLGRSFSEDEMTYSGSHVAVLTYPFWQTYFNGDPKVLGRTFDVDTVSTTVVGVLPEGFSYLSSHAQFYTPAASDPSERGANQRHNIRCQIIARLAPGATLELAQAQIAALDAAQLVNDPEGALIKSWGFRTLVDSLHGDHVRKIKPTVLLLQGGVLFLLLSAGVNLVNLLLVRASVRSKELAIRRSLGATSWHVAGQILSETLLIALLGGLLGWVIAAGGIRLLSILGADQLPLGATIAFNGRLAIAALLGSIVFGLLVAVPIAWFSIRRDPGAALQSESRGATGNSAVQGLRHVFTVIQIAVAFSLLAGAGMLGVSLQRLLGTSPGFQPAQVFTGQVVLPFNNYGTDTARQQFVERLVGALKGEPGITSAAVSCLMPFAGKDSNGITAVEGAEKGAQHIAYRNGVVGEYWRTLGIPLLEGRWLGDADNAGKPRVCVVDEAFARRNWHGKSPLGRRINDGIDFKPDESFTIVGVVGTVKQWEMADTEPLGTVYYPFRFWSDSAISVAVRSSLPPSVLGPALQRIVAQLDPQLPIDNLKPLQARIDDSLSSRRSPAVLAGIFAVVALLLTATGTYGVLSYAVGQRRREIGVRMALGALPQQVLAQFLGLGAKLLLVGIVLGFFGAWMAGRLMQSLLFGVGTLHPGILAAAAGLMVSVVLLATLIPSLRAARVSPTEALRGE